jgi:CheY-like chemotaxis protein
VEDEDVVRTLAYEILTAQGYRVLDATSGEEAIQPCMGHDGPTHLLVADVVMQGINGSELARRLMALDSDLKVLLMSGYTGDVIVGTSPKISAFAARSTP